MKPNIYNRKFYLVDHIHKSSPTIEQKFIDLAIIPSDKVSEYLARKIDQFRPHIIIFAWRDIQIYTPNDGSYGNPLQNSFEVFYSKNIPKKLEVLGENKINCISLWRNI